MKPNILFIIIDSLRADKVFGNQKMTSIPNIDSLIEKGTYFSNAITTNQFTAQVLQSIFISKFLLDNEEIKNYSTKDNQNSDTYLSLLKKEGYYTCATCQEDVFIQGFKEKFDDINTSFKSEDNIYNGLQDKILKKLSELTQPWFYYIHLEDLHTPCIVPEKLQYLKLFERYEKNISEIDLFIKKILEKIEIDKTLIIITADHGEYVSPVDGSLKEITGVKTNVKKLVKKLIPNKMREQVHLKKQSLNRKIHASQTNIPHEKRILSYKRQMMDSVLFDDIIHIPLILYGYSITPNIVINQQICNIDIFPTIFDLLGIFNSTKNNQGRSLIPLLKNLKFDSIPIYLTSQAITNTLKMNIAEDETSGPLIGIRTDNFKYFRNYIDIKKNVHLYDLKNDPLEDNNIADENKEIKKEMELHIQKIKENLTLSKSKNNNKDEINEDEIRRAKESLKKMGYI